MALPQAADAGRLFRYRDERGVMHMGTGLPPGQAQLGYEILDGRTLRVLNVVAPAPTREQLAQQAVQQRAAAAEQAGAAKAEQAERQALVDQRNHDRMLLETYATESDLLRLRDTKLGNLDLILRGIENTIGHLQQNLAQMQATAADHRKAGRQPPDPLRQALERTASDLATQQKAAVRMRTELVAVRTRFEADLDRYRRLTGALKTAAP